MTKFSHTVSKHTFWISPPALIQIWQEMARATRSSTQQQPDTEKELLSPPPTAKQTKKRKRTSAVDPDEQPALKQPRSEEPETNTKPEPEITSIPPPPIQNAAEAPIRPDDAQRILEVLEMCV